MEKESITKVLAKFVHNMSYEKLPDDVTHRAKNLLLDALGATIYGRDTTCPQIALELIKNNKGNATVIGHDLKVPILDAAFVNSVMAASTALDDFLFTFHPAQVNVPTAIVMAEQESSSGTELISALVAGYEVMARVYLGAPNIAPRFRGVGVYGPFGVAANAGKLLKLNKDQLVSALGFSGNFASGLTQWLKDKTMEGNFHGGMMARNGIIAANLAKAGAIASENTLEGVQGFYRAYAGTTEEMNNALLDLNERFLIMEASYKPYPVCAIQQVPIHLVLNLVKRHHIQPKDIKEIIEKLSEWDAAFPGTDFAGPFKRPTLSSAQFCAAAAFLGKPVGSSSFYEDEYNDPEILALAQKVKVIGEKQRKLPEIKVTLNDGKTYRIEEEEEKGTLRPTDEKIRAKFIDLTVNYLEEKRAKEVIDKVMSLEKMNNIKELIHLLRPLQN